MSHLLTLFLSSQVLGPFEPSHAQLFEVITATTQDGRPEQGPFIFVLHLHPLNYKLVQSNAKSHKLRSA